MHISPTSVALMKNLKVVIIKSTNSTRTRGQKSQQVHHQQFILACFAEFERRNLYWHWLVDIELTDHQLSIIQWNEFFVLKFGQERHLCHHRKCLVVVKV